MSKEEDFSIARNDLFNALQEFKNQCELSDDGEDFEAEVNGIINEEIE